MGMSDADKLKRAQSLVGTSKDRPPEDYYPTPRNAIEALLEAEKFEGDIWEPACGDGAISEVLKEHGYEVRSTDLIDRGYGEGGHDFLWATDTAPNIITNPPYNIAQPFIEKALSLTSGKVAMLCKLQFLEGVKRRKMFETTPLARVHVFSKRIKMARNGIDIYSSSMIAFCWLVWEHGYEGDPVLKWI